MSNYLACIEACLMFQITHVGLKRSVILNMQGAISCVGSCLQYNVPASALNLLMIHSK